MSKKTLFILLFFASLSLHSCEWVKERLGMPTSQELQFRREQTRQDSVLRAEYLRQEREQQQLLEDSIFDPAMSGDDEENTSALYGDTFPATGTETSAGFTPSPTSVGTNRFHVIVGSFRMVENAAKMVRQLAERGYRPEELLFKNGYVVVSAGSYPSLPDAQAAKQRIQSVDGALCPYDIYIYDMNQRRHVESGAR